MGTGDESDSGGAINVNGNVIGTYIHGIFDNDDFRDAFINYIRAKKGWCKSRSRSRNRSGIGIDWDMECDKLADLVRRSVDIDKIYKIMRL